MTFLFLSPVPAPGAGIGKAVGTAPVKAEDKGGSEKSQHLRGPGSGGFSALLSPPCAQPLLPPSVPWGLRDHVLRERYRQRDCEDRTRGIRGSQVCVHVCM